MEYESLNHDIRKNETSGQCRRSCLSIKEKVKKMMELSRSQDHDERQQLILDRRKSVLIALALFLLPKFLNLIKLTTILSGDVKTYLLQNPSVQVSYPISKDNDKFKSDCVAVIFQYCTLVSMNVLIILLQCSFSG